MTPAKAAPMREDVTRALEVLRALASLIERPPLDDVLLKLDASLRIVASIKTVIAHTARPDAGEELAEIKASMAYRTSLIGRETARADAAEAKLAALEAVSRPDAGDAEVERVASDPRMGLTQEHWLALTMLAPWLLSKGWTTSSAAVDAALAAMREGVDRGMIEGLREALKPFADAAEDVDEKDRDRDHLWEAPAAMNITVGNLRAASAALAALSPEQPR